MVRAHPRGVTLYNLLSADPVFQQAVKNPVPLALITYLLGYQCVLSSYQAWLKGPNTHAEPNEIGLHFDGFRVTTATPYVEAVSCQYLLTDQSKEHGATAFIPGSHRLLRPPTAADLDERIALEAPKGSVILWNSNLWHGSFSKVTPGLRMSVTTYFTRPQLRMLDVANDEITAEMIERNPPRFATLVGADGPWGGPLSMFRDNTKRLEVRNFQALYSRTQSVYGA
jgi:hypothetical protein